MDARPVQCFGTKAGAEAAVAATTLLPPQASQMATVETLAAKATLTFTCNRRVILRIRRAVQFQLSPVTNDTLPISTNAEHHAINYVDLFVPLQP